MQFPIQQKFKLSESFLERYKNEKPNFGFNGLGEFVFLRTYSRIKEDGKNEMWWEVVKRIVEGIYNIQRTHIEEFNLGWNNAKAQRSAQEMYSRIFSFKMLPAGRGLWAMGTPIVMDRGLTAALFNCSYLSTENLQENPGKIFGMAMDFLMCGIGVGADTLGDGKVKIRGTSNKTLLHIIPDDREGWVESVELLINNYVYGKEQLELDYSRIRKAGEPIRGFGGVSSGPEPLKELHKRVESILISRIDAYLTERDITDIFNLIGKAVVAGNVRRSAEIILGKPTEDFLDLKNYEKNPDRSEFGWASNNSIYATVGMNYKDIATRIAKNGEPGIFWLSNARKYGRVKETEANNKDHRVNGLNPCGEATLEPFEFCNLVETLPYNHDSIEDFKTTIKYAYLYAKTVTLLSTPWSEVNRIMLRNRRIGLSMTGLVQSIAKLGTKVLGDWMEEGYKTVGYYDKVYSEWFAVPSSIKTTTIKPSGTISLLAGATPGIHFPESNYYIRRVRLAKNSAFVPILEDSGYNIEPAVGQEDSTVVVEFPVSIGENVRTLNDVSMWEQLELAAFVQEHWADNSVSVTVTFDPEKEGKDIEHALDLYQSRLKAVSFLPKLEKGAYAQMPYEEITRERYEDMVDNLLPLDFTNLFSEEAVGEKYCANDGCMV
jgi:ribonucleoside-triphosphate reductase